MPIVQSHQLAAELLARPAGGISRAELRRVFLDQRGWWEDEGYRWDDNGTIQHGWDVSVIGAIQPFPGWKSAVVPCC